MVASNAAVREGSEEKTRLGVECRHKVEACLAFIGAQERRGDAEEVRSREGEPRSLVGARQQRRPGGRLAS